MLADVTFVTWQRTASWRILSIMVERKPPSGVGRRRVTFNIETERESEDRWIAEITDIPGVLAYGVTKQEAIAKAYALALRVIADEVEETKDVPASINVA
jgi:predicted RNase H-like HicB family nuclease